MSSVLPLCACTCGRDLKEHGKEDGVWTMAGVACEYRTCKWCHNTRAYMPMDKHPTRRVILYVDPETSEVSEEYESLLDAIEVTPATARAELRRNGLTLARAFVDPRGEFGWRIMRPQHEVGDGR